MATSLALRSARACHAGGALCVRPSLAIPAGWSTPLSRSLSAGGSKYARVQSMIQQQQQASKSRKVVALSDLGLVLDPDVTPAPGEPLADTVKRQAKAVFNNLRGRYAMYTMLPQYSAAAVKTECSAAFAKMNELFAKGRFDLDEMHQYATPTFASGLLSKLRHKGNNIRTAFSCTVESFKLKKMRYTSINPVEPSKMYFQVTAMITSKQKLDVYQGEKLISSDTETVTDKVVFEKSNFALDARWRVCTVEKEK